MAKIYKYEVDRINDPVELELPEKSEILDAQIQNGKVCLWVLFEDESKTVTRTFELVGTGWSFESTDTVYLATVQQGYLVWHLFELV